MKFLCDRCKTRYSIGDDRVRGKILKIRCKNCANVITVREGMSDADTSAPVGAANGARNMRPTTMSPAAAHTAPANGAKPPPALDEEWYVSIDGEQSGPFSLSDAQKWIGARPFDAELHCWSEGFDDWLPVDKVSHFRGVRKKPNAAPAPPPTPRAGARATGAVPAIEEEPKPLFAATMASLERGVEPSAATPRHGAPAVPIAKATPLGGVPVPRVNGTSGPAAKPASTPAPSLGPTKPGSGPTSASAKAGTGPTAVPAPVKRLQTQPGHTPAPVAVPGFDVAASLDASDANDASTAVGGAPFPEAAVPGKGPSTMFGTAPAPGFAPSPGFAAAPGFTAPAGAAPGFVAPAPMFPAPAARAPLFPDRPVADPAAPQSFDSADDDGLDIGEVSRVVNLADLMKSPPKKDRTGPVRRPGANGAAGAAMNRTGSAPKIDAASLAVPALSGTAPFVPLAGVGNAAYAPNGLAPDALGDGAAPELVLPPPPERQRRSLVALLVVAVLLLGGVGAVVAFALSGTNDPVQLGLGPTDQIDTTRPEDMIRHNPFVPTIGSNGSATTVPHPNGSGSTHVPHPNGSNTSSNPGSNGKTEGDPLGPTQPLKPDEVEDMSGKQATGATRCWERALRKQPYLQKDIKKVSVTINVDALGTVTNVQIAGMPTDDGNLGVCLQSFIRAWKFRQSSAGITAKFSMVFQN